MVDVRAALPSSGGLMGRMRSVLGDLQGLGTRIGTAFHQDGDLDSSDSECTTETRSSTYRPIVPPHPLERPQPFQDPEAERRKLRFPRFRNGAMYEDYDALIRKKLEQQEQSRAARVARRRQQHHKQKHQQGKNPEQEPGPRREPQQIGMTYEEIAKSSSNSTERHQRPDEAAQIGPATPEEERASLGTTTPGAEGPRSRLSSAKSKSNRAAEPCPTQDENNDGVTATSGATSEFEPFNRSVSLDSTTTDRESGCKEWPRSGSTGSIESWASNFSAESQSEENAAEFMKVFVPRLFESPATIEQEQKATFGQMVLTEAGRVWFARVVNARRNKPCVSEDSFYSLAQHFAVTLFECNEADDFSPAKSLMNMSFTFYHEIEVPGIEPYREYLYTNLRVQPIWTSMRFWTAAFFDAVQCERAAKPVPPRPKTADQEIAAAEDRSFQANIVFGQLGTFTCNMHAFGLPRNLCLEFLKKQSTIANLTKDQEKILRDNIEKMFDETEPWRS